MPKAFLLFMVVGVNNAPDSRELGFELRRNRRVCWDTSGPTTEAWQGVVQAIP